MKLCGCTCVALYFFAPPTDSSSPVHEGTKRFACQECCGRWELCASGGGVQGAASEVLFSTFGPTCIFFRSSCVIQNSSDCDQLIQNSRTVLAHGEMVNRRSFPTCVYSKFSKSKGRAASQAAGLGARGSRTTADPVRNRCCEACDTHPHTHTVSMSSPVVCCVLATVPTPCPPSPASTTRRSVAAPLAPHS